MMYSAELLALFISLIVSCDALRLAPKGASTSTGLSMALSDYKNELAQTAAKIAGPGKIIF